MMMAEGCSRLQNIRSCKRKHRQEEDWAFLEEQVEEMG